MTFLDSLPTEMQGIIKKESFERWKERAANYRHMTNLERHEMHRDALIDLNMGLLTDKEVQWLYDTHVLPIVRHEENTA